MASSACGFVPRTITAVEVADFTEADGLQPRKCPTTTHAAGTVDEHGTCRIELSTHLGLELGVADGDIEGSGNRAIGMLKGQIKGTILDLANKNQLMAKAAPGQFTVLPGVSNPASDETLFAGLDWIKKNEAQADIIVAEFYKLWNEMNSNPGVIDQERVKYKLMMDQPKEILAGVTGENGGKVRRVRK